MAEFEEGPSEILWHQTWGDPEAPPVLLIHDLLADHRAWLPCILPLAEEYRVIAMDLPGHGRSAPAGARGGSSIENLAERVDALLQAEQVGPCAMAGSGLGAFIALHLALERPEAAAAVVLADLPADAPSLPDLGGEALTSPIAPYSVGWLGKRAAAAIRDPFLAGGMRARFRTTDPESYASMQAAAKTFASSRVSIRGRLPMPVLLMAPDAGPLRSAAERTAADVDHARVALFRDAEAGVLSSRPDAVGDVVVDFFHDIEDGQQLAAHLLR